MRKFRRRWSAADLKALGHQKVAAQACRGPLLNPPSFTNVKPVPVMPQPFQGMNKTEVRFAKRLEWERLEGRCIDWRFEPFNVRLGRLNFYRPDFLVVRPEHFEIAEIKGGYIREDSIQKFKAARERLPWFRFLMWQYRRGQWTQVY